VGGAVGVVPLEGRDGLPFVDLHGETLLLHAVRALAEGGVSRVVVTAGPGDWSRVDRLLAGTRLPAETRVGSAWWAGASRHERLVLADPLCPLVPARFVARVLALAPQEGAAAGYRPVTDTVKTVVDQQIAVTLDRDALAIVASPVVLPGWLVAEETPPVHDFALLAAWIRKRCLLELVKAPSMARRVGDESALRVLECLDELGRLVQEA